MKEKIQINSILGNKAKFIIEKGSPTSEDELYHVIFDEKGYVMTKEEVKKLQKFFIDIKLD
ncbi:MAG: hypothetical protein EU530_11975 [Promethearchaeota archaeon]|nr:MAG: hypothetical protein EU530_11975 [Candidatus Lokiarchaeota archaeon]